MAAFPKADTALIDTDLEEVMGLVEKTVSLGRAARSRKNLKVRPAAFAVDSRSAEKICPPTGWPITSGSCGMSSMSKR